MRIPIFDKKRLRSIPVNLFLAKNRLNGEDAWTKRAGLVTWVSPSSDPIRALHAEENFLYAVAGGTVYSVDVFGNTTELGDLDSDTGDAWMDGNGTEVGIVSGGKFYYIDENQELQAGTGLSFEPGSLTFEGGHFLAHAVNTGTFYESDSLSAVDWNELDYGMPSIDADKIMCVRAVNGNVYAIGETTCEIYYNSGGSNFSFSKVPGGDSPVGTASAHNAASFMNSLFYLTPDRTIVKAGVEPIKVSTALMDREIGAMTKVNDAIGFTFSQSGHAFYAIAFPYSNRTFVLDIGTSVWHEWKTGNNRWSPNCHALFRGKNYFGCSNGNICYLSDSAYDDYSEDIIVQMIVPGFTSNVRTVVRKFELTVSVGNGLNSGQGSDPQIVLEYSKDKCKTWEYEQWRDLGGIGEYDQRVIWRRLGVHYDFDVRLTVSDPIFFAINGADLNG